MSSSLLSRRYFIASLGAAAIASTAGLESFASLLKSTSAIRFGYASITWEGNDAQAIKDISALGFPGIQLRSNILKEYGEKPAALKELLAQYKLEMVALSSGGVGIAPNTEADEITKHVSNAKFVSNVGGKYLQVTDSALPKDRKPEAADYKQLGKLLTEIGKRTKDLGIPLGYHNHMSSLGEAPNQVDWIMDAADPRYVKLELDIAHYQQGGGDPVRAIQQYKDRLLFLHIKDVETVAAADERNRNYRFVELGRGRVDLKGVFAALDKAKFKGWAVVELDAVPDKARTPKESGQISKTYLEQKLGLHV
ncbi:MAG: xylose isomerase [Acidobacteria bacterium]|nr:MAG: xylose isomerase [Acidobacteriota bacterium]